MTCACKNAQKVAAWLSRHPRVGRVFYPGLLAEGEQREIHERQTLGPGAMLAFELAEGGEEAAFRVLNGTELVKLAVSLGGTESLVEHPSSMTHSDVPPEEQAAIGITPGLIRLSVGIEHPDDLIADLAAALDRLEVTAVGLEAASEESTT